MTRLLITLTFSSFIYFFKFVILFPFLFSNMTSDKILPFLSPLAAFAVREYLCRYAPRLNAKRFPSMPINVNRTRVYENHHGVDRLSTVGGWIRRRVHLRGFGVVLRSEKATYVDIRFVRCNEERSYARCLAQIVREHSDLSDAPPITHCLDYVTF